MDRAALIQELRGMAERMQAAPLISYADKERVAELYPAVMGSTFRRTSCRNCYADAVIEMYVYLKNNGEMAENKKYILKRGKLITYNGTYYTRKTLTDSVAQAFLKVNPSEAKWFEKVPTEAEPVVKAVSVETEATAKKTAKKATKKENEVKSE